jgi:hypothetical protein
MKWAVKTAAPCFPGKEVNSPTSQDASAIRTPPMNHSEAEAPHHLGEGRFDEDAAAHAGETASKLWWRGTPDTYFHVPLRPPMSRFMSRRLAECG